MRPQFFAFGLWLREARRYLSQLVHRLQVLPVAVLEMISARMIPEGMHPSPPRAVKNEQARNPLQPGSPPILRRGLFREVRRLLQPLPTRSETCARAPLQPCPLL